MKNIYWHHGMVNREHRQKQNQHQSRCLWFTGLSGSGKSTIASLVEKELFSRTIRTYFLDGDNIRHGLNKDLGFSATDRKENIRRIGEVAKLFVDAGVVVLASFISPYQEDRQFVRELFTPGDFVEIYVECSVTSCEKRDPKGLYKKVRSGEIANFTGISAPYETPTRPELKISTEMVDPESSSDTVLQYLQKTMTMP